MTQQLLLSALLFINSHPNPWIMKPMQVSFMNRVNARAYRHSIFLVLVYRNWRAGWVWDIKSQLDDCQASLYSFLLLLLFNQWYAYMGSMAVQDMWFGSISLTWSVMKASIPIWRSRWNEKEIIFSMTVSKTSHGWWGAAMYASHLHSSKEDNPRMRHKLVKCHIQNTEVIRSSHNFDRPKVMISLHQLHFNGLALCHVR